MTNKRLLIVAHAPSDNPRKLRDAAANGARHLDLSAVDVTLLSPFDTTPEHVLGCDAILMGTTENLGYMSGALKDFFDRCYYPVLEKKQGLPCALFVRAGHDGTGTRRAVETIVTGLRWNWVQDPLILRGSWQDSFVEQVEELGMYLAASLDAGII